MMMWTLWLVACSGGDEAIVPSQDAPAAAVAPVGPRGASKAAITAEVSKEDGWGAVFWRKDMSWKVGGGDVVVSPTTASQVEVSGDSLACNGVALKDAPHRSALALPAGAPIPKIQKSPAIQAHLVERAAWRLDEVLPPRSKYSPVLTSKDPARQRGVHVGSVAKTRRYGSPPVLISVGVRECTAAVAILAASAERALTFDHLPNVCETMRVIPATDMDGDGSREFAVFNDTLVALYRLNESPGTMGLTRIGTWSCDAE